MAETLTAEKNIWSRGSGIRLVAMVLLWAVALVYLNVGLALSQTKDNAPTSPHKTPPDRLLQPMNRPMDELGVTGHDTTLCSDRWYTCSSYDRQQFDQKYIGVPLNELLRYGEPDWPIGERQGRGGTGSQDSSDLHDSLDKD
jgi:hypothetical protein